MSTFLRDDATFAAVTAGDISGGASVPTGAVFWFATASAPTGYLECNGVAVSRTTFAALFALIGTTFGVGNGTTTFNPPDLRGKFVRGYDDGSGVDTGRTFGSSQTDAMQGHVHASGQIVVGGATFNNGTGTLLSQNNTGVPIGDGVNGTPRTASETRPINVALLPCIKT